MVHVNTHTHVHGVSGVLTGPLDLGACVHGQSLPVCTESTKYNFMILDVQLRQSF